MNKIEQTIEQMVQALDTVEWHGGGSCWIVDDKKVEDAIQAGRVLLEELKGQEPVLWLDEEKKIIYWHNTHETDDYHGFKRTTPLYKHTQPAQPKEPLTDEQIYKVANDLFYGNGPSDTLAFARAIESAHNIGKGEA
jgi:hypothetical protein